MTARRIHRHWPLVRNARLGCVQACRYVSLGLASYANYWFVVHIMSTGYRSPTPPSWSGNIICMACWTGTPIEDKGSLSWVSFQAGSTDLQTWTCLREKWTHLFSNTSSLNRRYKIVKDSPQGNISLQRKKWRACCQSKAGSFMYSVLSTTLPNPTINTNAIIY